MKSGKSPLKPPQATLAALLLAALSLSGAAPAGDSSPLDQSGERILQNPQNKASFSLELLQALMGLGSPSRDERWAARQWAKARSGKMLPVLESWLYLPKSQEAWLRMGALRAIEDSAPLSPYTGGILARVAVLDPDPEVRREACAVIRRIQDRKALWHLEQCAGQTDDLVRHQAASIALREIGNEEIIQRLVAAVPPPIGVEKSVRGSLGEEGLPATNQEALGIMNGIPRKPGLTQPRKYTLPVGPLGLNVPIFLPVRSVDGCIFPPSPEREALRVIAGKNMGYFPLTWANWYLEWVGRRTVADYEEISDKSTIRDSMNLVELPERETEWRATILRQFAEKAVAPKPTARPSPGHAIAHDQELTGAGFDLVICKAEKPLPRNPDPKVAKRELFGRLANLDLKMPLSENKEARDLIGMAAATPEFLVSILNDKTPDSARIPAIARAGVRAKAAYFLGEGGSREALDSLIEACLGDEDDRVRLAAALALPKLDEPVALRRLMDRAIDGRLPWIHRQIACIALRRYGDHTVIERLLLELSYELAGGQKLDPKNKLRMPRYGPGTDDPLKLKPDPILPDKRVIRDLYPVLAALECIADVSFEEGELDVRTWKQWWLNNKAGLQLDRK